MRLLVRLAPRISVSTTASSSSRRMLHASASLDPSRHTPEPTMANVVTESHQQEASDLRSAALSDAVAAAASSENFVHVKMQYLHPSTKDPMAVRKPGDLKTGRIRAEPHYVPLSAHVFGIVPRRDVLHSAVVYYLDGLRRGTASTKTRGEVAFSTRKLYQQKGTGRARRGSRGSPLLRKGGVAHGPRPRDFSTKLNRRVRELALRSALSLRWRNGDLVIVKNLLWDKPPGSCNPLARLLKAKGWDDALFLTAPRNPQPAPRLGRTGKTSAADPVYTEDQIIQHAKNTVNFSIAVNNIPRTRLVLLNDLTRQAHESARTKQDRKRPGELHAYEVLQRKKLICDVGAIEYLEEQMGGALFHAAGQHHSMSLEELMAENDVDEPADATVAAMSEQLEDLRLTADEEGTTVSEEAADDELREAEDRAIEEETERVLEGLSADEDRSSLKKKGDA